MDSTKPYRLLNGRMLEVENGDFICLLNVMDIVAFSVQLIGDKLFADIDGRHGNSTCVLVDADFYPWLKEKLLNRELEEEDDGGFTREGGFSWCHTSEDA